MKLIFSKKKISGLTHIDYETLKLFINNKIFFKKKMITDISNNFYKSVGIWHLKYFNTNKKIKNWQYSQNTRIAAWYPYDLSSLLKYYIIIEIINFNKLDKVNIVGCSKESYDYFVELSKHHKLHIVNNQFNLYDNLLKNFKTNFFLLKKSIYEFLKLFIIFFSYLTKKKIKTFKKKYDLLFITNDLKNNNNDHFYGNLIKFKKIFGSKFNLLNINFIINNKKNYSFNYMEWLSLKDLLWIFSNLLSFLFIKNKINNTTLTISNSKYKIKSNLFSINFTNKVFSDSFILFELIIQRSLINFLKFNDIKNIVYPLENKPIEYSILNAVKSSKKSIKTYAYLHANYSSGHIAINNLFSYKRLLPNFFLSKNIYQQNRLINHYGWKSSLFISVGNLRRVNYLPNIVTYSKTNIVFIPGYGFELIEFSKWCVDLKSSLKNFNLIIKPYPFSWEHDQKTGFDLLNLNKINYTINNNLINSIDKSSIVLYGSTSAGLELLHTDKIIINLDLDNRFFINPLMHLDKNNLLIKCNYSLKLKSILDNYNNLIFKNKILVNQKKYFVSSLESVIIDDLFI